MAQLLFKTASGVSLLQEDCGCLVSTNPCEIIVALKRDCKSTSLIDVMQAASMLSYITSCGGIRKIGKAINCPRSEKHFYVYETDSGGKVCCGFTSANLLDKKVDGFNVTLKVW